MRSNGKGQCYTPLYELVRSIPPGRVTAYGVLARFLPGITARMVGYALHAADDDTLPWWRVVNSRSRISLPMQGSGALQAALLRKEGLTVDDTGKVHAAAFWTPDRN